MDVQNTISRHDQSTAPSSLDPDAPLAANLAANPPEVTDDRTAGGEPGDSPIYGQMTKPSPDATVGRVPRIVRFLTTTARQAASDLTSSIRRDPWSATAVGMGLAWLLLQWWSRKNVSTAPFARKLTNVRSLGGVVPGSILTHLHPANATSRSQINDMAQRVATVAGMRMQQLSQPAQQLGSRIRGRVEDLSGGIQETVREVGGEAQVQAKARSNDARAQVNRLGNDFQGTFQRLTGTIDEVLRQNLVNGS